MFVEGGKIKLIIGPMFSGKSTMLTDTVRKYVYKGMKTILVNYAADKRYDKEGKIVTHELVKYNALSCFNLQEHFDELMNYDVIGIDEGQFFPDLVEVSENLCKNGKIVVVSALSGNFKMEPFDNVSKLISKADKIKLLKAYCYFCHKRAGFTLRTVQCDQEILIGAADMYRPACKACHYKNNLIQEKKINSIEVEKEVEMN